MSEPLNEFLEEVEQHLANSHDNDAKLGRDIRASWERMVAQESIATHSEHVVINRHGFPVQVAVPLEG